MACNDDLHRLLENSSRRLRAWDWMSRISSDPESIVALLREEARGLIDLGRRHPESARQIGGLIVAHHALIQRIEQCRHHPAAGQQA
jgi:hypothetical protein